MVIAIETTEPVKINTAKSKAERFFDMYASRFGPLTEKDGIDEWRRMIDRDGYDELSMSQALDKIADKLGENQHFRKPRIGWVRSEYNKSRESGIRRSGGVVEARFTCSSCAGKGWIVGIRIRSERQDLPALLRDPRRIPSDIKKGCVTRHPCHCHKGAAEWARSFSNAPHDTERGKEMAEVCLPDTMENEWLAGCLVRQGRIP